MARISLRATRRNRQFEQASALAHHGEEPRAAKLIACAREDFFRERGQLSRFRCQLGRDCFYCSPIAAKKQRDRYAARIVELIYGGWQLCLLTLTIPSLDAISKNTYKSLWSAFRMLKRRTPFCKTWSGIFARIETSHSLNYGFHPHIHALIVHKAKMESEVRIAATWRELTAASIVWVEPVNLENRSIQSIVEHVFSYILKFTDFESAEARVDYHVAVKDVRLTAAYGVLRGKRTIS